MAGVLAPGVGYREECALSFSQLASALNLRQGFADVLHARKSPTNEYMRAGTEWEPVIRALFCREDARFASTMMPAVPARLGPEHTQGLHGSFAGCADNIVPGMCVVDYKLLTRRQLWDGPLVPVDYLPQLHACALSLGVRTAYLVVYRHPFMPTAEMARPLRMQLLRGQPLDLPGGTLAVYRYDLCDGFWRDFVLPRLALFQDWRRLAATQGPRYCPTMRRNNPYYDPHYMSVPKCKEEALLALPPNYSQLEMHRTFWPLTPPLVWPAPAPEEDQEPEEDPMEVDAVLCLARSLRRQEELASIRALEEGCARLVRALHGGGDADLHFPSGSSIVSPQ